MDKVKKIVLYIIGLYLLLVLIREIYFPWDNYLGGHYVYYQSPNTIFGLRKNQINIPHDVVSYNYNKRYIVAKQYFYGGVDPEMYNLGNRTYNGIGYYYWIIDKDKDTVYGPMDSIKYVRRCKSFKNLPTLDMDKVSTFE